MQSGSGGGRAGASRCESGGGVAAGAEVPGGVRREGPELPPVAPMRCHCAGGEAALLRPGGAAHTVALKSRQQVRVLRDRQRQKFQGCIDV